MTRRDEINLCVVVLIKHPWNRWNQTSVLFLWPVFLDRTRFARAAVVMSTARERDAISSPRKRRDE